MAPSGHRAIVRRRRRVAGAILVGLVFGGGGGVGMATLTDLPGLHRLEDYTPPTATRILDRNGKLIDEIFIERRDPVKPEQIPQDLKDALIATEDVRFYDHHGIDVIGLSRAVARGVIKREGFKATSGITQQLARNLFLTQERTLSRKLKEAALAFQIEQRYTKQQILTLYLNQIYLGSGTFGVEAASKRYFGKSVSELDLGQCAMLAGLPKSPSGYDPFRHPEKAKFRRDVVLGRLRDAGFITPAEVEKWQAKPLGVVPFEEAKAAGAHRAPYFVAQLKQELEARFGEEALYQAGLQVWTTLDLDVQTAGEEALSAGIGAVAARQADWLRRNAKRKGIPSVADAEKPQGALLAIDPANGDIRAMIGGTDWRKSQYNRATVAQRQPGSAFKPLVYAAAIEAGWTQSSLLWDAPLSYPNRATGRTWNPKNYYPGFKGRMTLRTALEQSSNAASIYLLERIGVGSVVDGARRLGVTSKISPNLTLALGSSDLTLSEITRAYAAFANGGVRTETRMVLKVLDRNGRPLYSAPPAAGRAVMTPENAYVMSDLLRGVTTTGLSRKVGELPFWVAGKTGTTNDSTDALFVGFSSNLAAGIWVGMDSHAPMRWGESGGRAAQPIFLDFMGRAVRPCQAGEPDIEERGGAERRAGSPTEGRMADRGRNDCALAELPSPPGVVTAEVDPGTGFLATERCAERIVAAFVAGTQPTRSCADEEGGPVAAPRYTLDLTKPTW